MMEILGTIFSGVFSGGATGLIGIGIQRYFDYKKQRNDLHITKMQLDAAKEQRKLELDYQERIAANAAATDLEKTRINAEVETTKEVESSYRESMENDKATFSTGDRSPFVSALMGIVDFVRGMTRPVITYYTLALMTAVFFWVRSLYVQMGIELTQDQAFKLTMQSVETVFYLATTCVVWWFGVRPAQPKGR